jgi:hypothetical protein
MSHTDKIFHNRRARGRGSYRKAFGLLQLCRAYDAERQRHELSRAIQDLVQPERAGSSALH